MSLKDALERKQRRSVVVPVQTSDPNATMQELQGVAAAIGVARGNGEAEVVASLNERLTQLQAEYETHFASVRMQSLPANEWESATALYQDEAGRFDWATGLPVLLAESCVDPDLRDAAWWKDQLAKDSWSDGDIKALQAAVLHLNTTAMDALIPKD